MATTFVYIANTRKSVLCKGKSEAHLESRHDHVTPAVFYGILPSEWDEIGGLEGEMFISATPFGGYRCRAGDVFAVSDGC